MDVACSGCGNAIYDGQEILLIDFGEEEPAVIHMRMDCLMGLEEVVGGVIGPSIEPPMQKITRIK